MQKGVNIMTHHDALWKSLEYVADKNNKSFSGLARACKLDSTTFNPSKRHTSVGQPRWISTETLAKVLITTNTAPTEFAQMYEHFLAQTK